MLGKFGQDFVMTENGQQAVEVYKSSPDRFPVIFMGKWTYCLNIPPILFNVQ
ncbi:hypothetical protein F5B22DRAFT_604539 [Xylaria bambusicola]|uniref:uncharacterized protein n=1 Tax=Xylaria bambusicola TaxID=326684 RepID=UPI0020073A88|nr:uncharacterized protein F5B22DRAFT_604539 [Xylaria bambusicola]KAI0517410.1 hypothetical protein F5B22DRAFT_604539 [Xylaria bambusicola]